jgi:hypothetical protein
MIYVVMIRLSRHTTILVGDDTYDDMTPTAESTVIMGAIH